MKNGGFLFSEIGSNQAIRIPREFGLGGTEAILHKEGNKLIIESVPNSNRLLALLETLGPLDEDFPEIEDPSAQDEIIF